MYKKIMVFKCKKKIMVFEFKLTRLSLYYSAREFDKGPNKSMEYYLHNSGQYEDISDQENESDFIEPEPKQPVVQKDPFEDNSDREERRTPSDKSDRMTEQEHRTLPDLKER
jgi:hypothetical protein